MTFASMRLAAALLALGVAACNNGRGRADGGGSVDDTVDMSRLTDELLDLAIEPDLTKRPSCVASKAPASPAKRPIDLILVVDNSGSMRNKIRGVEGQINKNLTDVLDKSGIDYRVIVISLFGYWMDNKICPAKPLSDNDCVPPIKGPPRNTARYFHFDYDIQSTDAYRKVLATFNMRDTYGLAPNGWGSWLRPNATKAFLFVTDDNSDLPASQFEFMLRVLDPINFGNAQKRNFVVHAIVGMKGNQVGGKMVPWTAKDPVQATKCGVDAENNSEEHQNLAVLTGGLRFPICEWANFDPMFVEVTKGVVDGTKLACEMIMPEAPPKSDGSDMRLNIDYPTVVLEYLSPLNANLPVYFKQVPSAGACALDSFYLSQDKTRIFLCPQTCARVQADNQAQMSVLFDCEAELM